MSPEISAFIVITSVSALPRFTLPLSDAVPCSVDVPVTLKPAPIYAFCPTLNPPLISTAPVPAAFVCCVLANVVIPVTLNPAPTYKSLAIPAPPSTTKAPVADEDEGVVASMFTAPTKVPIPPTFKLEPIFADNSTPRPPSNLMHLYLCQTNQ
ncbi:MAG: hypothetical protein CM15mV1_3090 [uncultured marine virus]|nr:MAG: hypothetical protein CM15mV1_3090 [uncultured marine virus]